MSIRVLNKGREEKLIRLLTDISFETKHDQAKVWWQNRGKCEYYEEKAKKIRKCLERLDL